MTVKSVKISRCNLIKNKKGNIIKFISKDNKLLSKFGEIYFSEIKKGKVKGWNYHKKYTCLLTVPSGKVMFSICKSTSKRIRKVILSEKNNSILKIPPKFWFSFTSLVKKSLVTNVLSGVHDPSEVKKKTTINKISIK